MANMQRKRRLDRPGPSALAFDTPTIDQGPGGRLGPQPTPITPMVSQAEAPAQQPRLRLMATGEVDAALQMTHQNKITTRNAWDIRLIEGMEETVHSKLSDQADQYAQFSYAAQIVEGGAKVWTHRVDSTYSLSAQMVKRLLRNDTRKDADGQDNDDPNNTGNTQRRRKKTSQIAPERTLAANPADLNVDGGAIQLQQMPSLSKAFLGEVAQPTGGKAASGSKGALASHGALFRAVTEKADQGHARGLLMLTAPTGRCANFILDRDFAKPEQEQRVVDTTALDSFGDEDQSHIARISFGDPRPAAPSGRPSSTVVAHDDVTALEPEPVFQALPTGRTDLEEVESRMRSQRNSMEDYDDDNNNDGGFDDYDDGADDQFNASSRSLHASRAGSVARGLLSGEDRLNQFDAAFATPSCALEVENAGWVPLSQSASTSRLLPRRDSALNSIRKQALAKTQAGTGEPIKRRKTEKGVTFANLADEAALVDLSQPVKINKSAKDTTNCTPLGRTWLTDKEGKYGEKYADPQYCHARAMENCLVLRDAPNELAASGTLPQWFPLDCTVDVRSMFQPFSTSGANWNLLRKSMASAAAPLNKKSSHMIGGGALGVNDDANDNLMPMDLFDDDNDAGDYMADDYDDDGNDDDLGGSLRAPTTNFASGFLQADELPKLSEAALPSMLGQSEAHDMLSLLPDHQLQQLLQFQQETAVKGHELPTAPTQVDVVRLRQVMWNKTLGLGKLAEERRQRKQSGDDDEDSYISQVRNQTGLTDELLDEGAKATFSDIALQMLPEAASITKQGKLSPAFLFFSLLFLANEKGLDLRQLPRVGDENNDGVVGDIAVFFQ